MRIRRTPGPTVQPRRRSRPRSWPVPVGLLVLSAIPLLAGTPAAGPAGRRPGADPRRPAVRGQPGPRRDPHRRARRVFALLGILQLVPRFRARHLALAPSRGSRRRRGRSAGRRLGVLDGARSTRRSPAPVPLLLGLRLVFALAMTACLVLGVPRIRRRDVAGHRAWMIRAYAIALAAGTQAFTGGFAPLLPGSGALKGDLAMGSAWFINLAVAEWVIRRGAAAPPPRRPRARREPGRCPRGRRRDTRATTGPTGSASPGTSTTAGPAGSTGSPSRRTTTARARSPARWPTRLSCTGSSPGCATSASPSCRSAPSTTSGTVEQAPASAQPVSSPSSRPRRTAARRLLTPSFV